ncbi:hypothetical protein ScPMuIL_003995 [Solemya velum]
MYRRWIFFVGLVAAVAQLAGFATPCWVRYGGEGSHMAHGIWYSCNSENCHVFDENDKRDSGPDALAAITSPDQWLEFQIETSIGVITVLFALSLVWGWGYTDLRFVGILSALAFLVSGIATWIPAGKVLKFYVQTGQDYTDIVYYSAVLSAIGATIALIITFIVILFVCRRRKTFHHTNDTQALHVATTEPDSTELQPVPA